MIRINYFNILVVLEDRNNLKYKSEIDRFSCSARFMTHTDFSLNESGLQYKILNRTFNRACFVSSYGLVCHAYMIK